MAERSEFNRRDGLKRGKRAVKLGADVSLARSFPRDDSRAINARTFHQRRTGGAALIRVISWKIVSRASACPANDKRPPSRHAIFLQDTNLDSFCRVAGQPMESAHQRTSLTFLSRFRYSRTHIHDTLTHDETSIILSSNGNDVFLFFFSSPIDAG